MVSYSRRAWCSLLSLILGVGLVLTSILPASARVQEEEVNTNTEWVVRTADVNKLVHVAEDTRDKVLFPPKPQVQARAAEGRLASEFNCRNGFGCNLRL